MSEQFIDAKELAAKLKVPISWVYDRTRNGGPDRIPFLKLGRYVRFIESEVLAYLMKRNARNNDQTP